MTGDGMGHPTGALAEYAAGSLDPPARSAVETHLAGSLWALRLLTVGVPELAHGWLAAWMRAVWSPVPGPSR